MSRGRGQGADEIGMRGESGAEDSPQSLATRMGAALNPEILPQTGLIVLAGIPGSGKSTLVQSTWPGAKYISTDDYRAKAPNSAGSWDQSASRWAFMRAHDDAKRALAKGETVVFDSVAATESARKDLRDLAPKGIDKHLVVVHRGLDAALAGNRARGLYDPMREIPEHVIHSFSDRLWADADKTPGFATVSVVSNTKPASDEVQGGFRRSEEEREELEAIIFAGPEELDKAFEDGRLLRLFPELAATRGLDQRNKHHELTLDQHIREVYANAHERGDKVLMWAALLHDNHKPASCWIGEDGQAHYYRPYKPDSKHPGKGKEDHEVIGARRGIPIMQEYGLTPEEIRATTLIIRNHMFSDPKDAKGMRKLVQKMGGDTELTEKLISFRECDRMGKGNGIVYVADDLRRLLNEAAQPEPVKVKLAVNGSVLRDKYKLKGPQIGSLVKHLQEHVQKNPTQNQADDLHELAQAWLASSQ